MQRYEITGMSCAACASHVEKAVSAVPVVSEIFKTSFIISLYLHP